MTFLGVDIASASLFAGLVIGFGSLWLGKRVYCPMTVLYIPALLPMIPGKFAYNMVFSLIMCLQNMNDPEQLDKFMGMFFSNSLIASTVIFMLAVGATFPMFLFPHRAAHLPATSVCENGNEVLHDRAVFMDFSYLLLYLL